MLKEMTPPQRRESLAPLSDGDRLTRQEFERRYEAMPYLQHAELIEGVVYMGSPVLATHSRPHARIMTWIGLYSALTPGVDVADNGSLRLDEANEYQPDGLLYLAEEWGGRCHITADNYLAGPPELVVEVAASSAAYDLNKKLNVYRQHGVQEYLVWEVYKNHFHWFILRDGQYEPLLPDTDGIIRSHVFPGLHLAVTALLADDVATVLATLRQGMETEAYAAFGQRLTALKSGQGAEPI